MLQAAQSEQVEFYSDYTAVMKDIENALQRVDTQMITDVLEREEEVVKAKVFLRKLLKVAKQGAANGAMSPLVNRIEKTIRKIESDENWNGKRWLEKKRFVSRL